LHHYKIELQHLNPNEIQHIATFVTLCEGYLGIEPHFELWKYFFVVSLQKKREKHKAKLSMLMGCTSIGRSGRWVHPDCADQILQGVTQAAVLSEE
jgi:hypothetical protein